MKSKAQLLFTVLVGLKWLICLTPLAAQSFHGGSKGKQSHYQQSFFAFLFPTIKGSGVPLSNERAVKPFHSIVVQDPFRVVIRQGSSYQVRVVSDDNLPDFIRTTVSDDSVLTIALAMQNYDFDTLAVFITTPTLSAMTLGMSSETLVEAPLTLPQLTTNLIGGDCGITFAGGVIGKHIINEDGLGSRINCANIQSDEVRVRMAGLGAECYINAARIEPIGDFGIGASLYYSLQNGKPPQIIGSGGKGLGVHIQAIESPVRKEQNTTVQPPLPLSPKN